MEGAKERIGAISGVLLVFSSVALAAPVKLEKPGIAYPSPRDEQIALQKKLAKAHKRAAECLEAGGATETCEKQLAKSCPAAATEQCSGLTQQELERHAQTYSMTGRPG
jgi:hypothetical protein